jgi:hypothetical protein
MINLKGKRPDSLTNKETIIDILQELEDTGKWKIEFVSLDNGKHFTSLVESGQVSFFEADWNSNVLSKVESFVSDVALSIRETRWDIKRYPIRLKVTYCGGESIDFRKVSGDSLEVYQRLKDYIQSDIIQDQFLYTNFQIDFIDSDVRLIK